MNNSPINSTINSTMVVELADASSPQCFFSQFDLGAGHVQSKISNLGLFNTPVPGALGGPGNINTPGHNSPNP